MIGRIIVFVLGVGLIALGAGIIYWPAIPIVVGVSILLELRGDLSE